MTKESERGRKKVRQSKREKQWGVDSGGERWKGRESGVGRSWQSPNQNRYMIPIFLSYNLFLSPSYFFLHVCLARLPTNQILIKKVIIMRYLYTIHIHTKNFCAHSVQLKKYFCGGTEQAVSPPLIKNNRFGNLNTQDLCVIISKHFRFLRCNP